MKKKIFLIGLLMLVGTGVLVGCNNKQNNNDGSNANQGNEQQSTGVINEIVTDAVNGVKDAATKAGEKMQDMATDAASGAKNLWDDLTNR